jgi:hypothetical protein
VPNDDEMSDDDVLEEVLGLSKGERIISSLIGMAAASAGVTAVFVSSNDIGSVALLALSAIFLLMAATGVRITSAKLGDNEIKLQHERFKQKVLEAAPEEDKPAVAEALVKAELDPLTRLAFMRLQADATKYEAQIYEALLRLMLGGASLERAGSFDGWDVTIQQGDRRVGVVVKYSETIAIRPLSSVVVSALKTGRAQAVIVVTRRPLHDQAITFIENIDEQRARVFIVGWDGPQDDDNLRRAVEAALSR